MSHPIHILILTRTPGSPVERYHLGRGAVEITWGIRSGVILAGTPPESLGLSANEMVVFTGDNDPYWTDPARGWSR